MLRTLALCFCMVCLWNPARSFVLTTLPLRSAETRSQNSATSINCNLRNDGPMNMRRDVLKLITAATAGSLLNQIWSSTPVLAFTETKEDLVARANYIVKALSDIDEPLQSAESLWALNRTIAQQNYDDLHRALSAGALSGLRTTCFHLYRNHVVDSQKYQDAEGKYKDLIKSIEKINSSILLASRDQLKEEEVKAIRTQLGDSVSKLRAFIDSAA